MCFISSKYSWPFKILIKVAEHLYSYHPKSDFLLQYGSLVRLMVEVQSQSSDDKYRLLLQAASVVRFANTHLEKYQKDKNFYLVTVYIDKSGQALRRIVYQDTNNDNVRGIPLPNIYSNSFQVIYTKPQVFDLNVRKSLIGFIFGLYNLVSWVENKVSYGDVEDSMAKVARLEVDSSDVAKEAGVTAWTVKAPRN